MEPQTPISFNPNIPEVHSINSFHLEKDGWRRHGSVYTKDGKKLEYNGVCWKLDNVIVQFMEDLKK